MAKILVIYHSRSGNTEKMAEYVAEGAKQTGALVDVKSVEEVNVEELLNYDGIIIGSPTYYGTMSAEIKQLFDQSVRFHGQLTGKVGGAFASAGGFGGGSETTCLDILKSMLVHGMIVVGNVDSHHYGAVSAYSPDRKSIEQCKILGKLVASLANRLIDR